ncbi:FG-GAP repeat domain-containing protein, partial [Acrocarpospora phusangensis]|uniref:FG-GAP repeat domain-containing protein n=1 Tax=Acrocarpospora phusangensis TaxID=1070424 RepID=UPI0019519F7D
ATGGVPSFAPLANLGNGWNTLTKLVLGDFTGDGKVDIAGWTAGSADQLWVIPNTTSGTTLSRGQSIPMSTGWASITSYLVADYDGDGKTDLLGVQGDDQMFTWRGTHSGGTPGFTALTSLGTAWSTISHIPTAQ